VADELAGRVALITGGSRNIGRALALRFAAAGASVAITYNTDADNAATTLRLITERGGTAQAYRTSLEEPEAPERLHAAVSNDFGTVDLLVNSAAIRPRQPLGEVSAEAFDAVFAVNVRAGFLLAQAVAPGMRAKGFGRILFFGGLSSYIGQPSRAAVMASKLAVVGVARSLAFELAPAGVTVNVVVPGRIDTERGALEHYGPARDRAAQAALVPVGRLGSTEDVAELCLFLVSPAASFLTGQELFVTGGAYPLTTLGVG
jgi:NAD(P)-dependent dehydrogenase (short-subunit alcohol dehydrogenase family)